MECYVLSCVLWGLLCTLLLSLLTPNTSGGVRDDCGGGDGGNGGGSGDGSGGGSSGGSGGGSGGGAAAEAAAGAREAELAEKGASTEWFLAF